MLQEESSVKQVDWLVTAHAIANVNLVAVRRQEWGLFEGNERHVQLFNHFLDVVDED